MEVRSGYRQTEVGIIPDEWQVPHLRQHLVQDATYGVVKAGAFQRSGIPMLRGGDIKGGSVADDQPLITPEKSAEYSRTLLRQHDVVIALVGYPGESAVIPERLVGANISRAVGLLRPASTLSPFFLACYLNSPNGRREFLRPSAGSAQVVVNLRALNKLRLPLPSLPEQRAIAAALSDVDALLGGLDRLIAKKRDLKQAAMQQLLTGQTRLRGFSGEWEVKRLGEIADVLKGSALSKSLLAASGAHPCILYGELFTTYGRVIANVVSRTNSSEGCRSVAGDVLLPGSTTTTGADLATASALLIEDVALGGDIIIVRRKGKSHDPVFLASYLTHTARHEIADLTQGITIHHLYGKDLKTLSLHLPSLQEQTAIAAALSDMDAELAALEARRDKTRDLKQAMMQELLTGRTRLV